MVRDYTVSLIPGAPYVEQSDQRHRSCDQTESLLELRRSEVEKQAHDD